MKPLNTFDKLIKIFVVALGATVLIVVCFFALFLLLLGFVPQWILHDTPYVAPVIFAIALVCAALKIG